MAKRQAIKAETHIARPPPARQDRETQGQRSGPTDVDMTAGLRMLLDIEAESRKAESLQALDYLIANETRKLTRARQIFVFRGKKYLKLKAITGLTQINRDAKLVQDIEVILRLIEERHDARRVIKTKRDALVGLEHDILQAYPFIHFLWVPLASPGRAVNGGILLAREKEWGTSDIEVATRLGETYSHAMALLIADPGRKKRPLQDKLKRNVFFVIVGLLLFIEALIIPVDMNSVAPMEITAHRPFVVAAPLEGMIEQVMVDPSEPVKAGQPLVMLSDTVLRNKYHIAQKEVQIAEARLKTISQLAFSNEEDRHDLRAAMADLQLKKVELTFAEQMLDRSLIRAERDGIAVFANKQDLIGKPVETGAQIMQIADPEQIDISIDIPVGDALILKRNAEVKVYLDSDPINGRRARIISSDYRAHETATGGLAFRAVARFETKESEAPRIGNRGVARIYGNKTALGLYLFRRPIAALRRWINL